jgi:hypothetical protein
MDTRMSQILLKAWVWVEGGNEYISEAVEWKME